MSSFISKLFVFTSINYSCCFLLKLQMVRNNNHNKDDLLGKYDLSLMSLVNMSHHQKMVTFNLNVPVSGKQTKL